jgi:hypothetical protein
LKLVESFLAKRGDELNVKLKQLDERNAALRTLAVDLAMLRKQHTKITDDNQNLNTRLKSLQRVDEIHIEIDLLS